MKFFVTGATGFLGTYFVQHAIQSGHSVKALKRPGSPARAAIPDVQWVDLELDQVQASNLEGCDALVHFAAAGVSPKQASRLDLMHWNVTASQLLLERAHTAGVRRVVVAGSYAEYGLSADKYDLIPPNAPLLPTTSYASSKAACFVTCHATAVELGLELCYPRVFSAYGEGQFESNFWPALRKAALEGRDFEMTAGEQIRDYVPVNDVAIAFLHAASRDDIVKGAPTVYNVGSGRPVTMRAFAEGCWNRWHAKGQLKVGALPYRANEVMRFAPLITDPMPSSGERS